MTGTTSAYGAGATLFEKIWREHVVKDLGNDTFLI